MPLAQPGRVVLASASPRRLELLRQIGLDPSVVVPAIHEGERLGESPTARVLRLAETKGLDVAARLTPAEPAAVVLAADTEVALDGRTLGKPTDPGDAEQMLRGLRGRVHEVLTGVFLLRTDDGRVTHAVERTRVHFRAYEERTIRWYVATGEPLDKAGAYGIQGRGALLVERVEGSWFNVVGLPVERLVDWLLQIDVDLTRLVGPAATR